MTKYIYSHSNWHNEYYKIDFITTIEIKIILVTNNVVAKVWGNT